MDQATLVARLWSLTQDIGYAASMADWPKAAQLTNERSPLFALLDTQQAPDQLAIIRQIQDLDSALLADADLAQTELHAEYRSLIARMNAAGEYQRMAGG